MRANALGPVKTAPAKVPPPTAISAPVMQDGWEKFAMYPTLANTVVMPPSLPKTKRPAIVMEQVMKAIIVKSLSTIVQPALAPTVLAKTPA